MSQCEVCGGTGEINTNGSMVMQKRHVVGVSRERFALDCGLTTQTIFLVEKNKVKPRASTRKAIADTFRKYGVEFIWHD
jgi:DNA-binding XRE family transcriptional regulator